MSRRKFGEGRDGGGPIGGGDENLEVIGLEGDRLDTSEERGLVIGEEGSIGGSQGVVLERVQEIADNGVGLEGTPNARVSGAVAAVAGGGVLVRV